MKTLMINVAINLEFSTVFVIGGSNSGRSRRSVTAAADLVPAEV